jgi:hypothetical protein
MTGLSEEAKRELMWTGPDPSGRVYVLSAGDQEIGSLEFEDQEGSHASGRLAGCEWIFERSGVLHPRVRIRPADSEEPVAELALRFTGSGVVSFASGARYSWRPGNVLTTRWCLRREGEDKLICFVQEGGLSARGAKVVPCGDCAALPEFPVLVLLGWYLRVLLSHRLSNAAVSCEQ